MLCVMIVRSAPHKEANAVTTKLHSTESSKLREWRHYPIMDIAPGPGDEAVAPSIVERGEKLTTSLRCCSWPLAPASLSRPIT